MALTRTLEMLKAGERINDLLYRATLNGSRLPLAQGLAAVAARSTRDMGRWSDPPRPYRAPDPTRG